MSRQVEIIEELSLSDLGHDSERERPNHLGQKRGDKPTALCGATGYIPNRTKADRKRYGLCVVCVDMYRNLYGCDP